MTSSVRLRIILGQNNSQRVILQDGMPTSVADLSKEVAKQCNLQGSFRLQFMDPDFDDDFMNLMSTSEIQDKSTLKVVSLTTSSDRDGSPIPHVDTSQNESACSSPALSLLSCDTLVFSPPSPSANSESSASLAPVSSSSIKSSAWPAEFTVPRFTYDAELKLEQGNAAFKTQGAFLSPDPKLKISILDGLAEEIVKYKLYPSDAEYGQVAEALIKKHHCLKERGSVTGYSGWKASLKYKLGNYRTKLRNIGYTEVTVNTIKHKPDGISSPAYRVKKPRKAEVNYCPSHPQGETDETLEAVRQTLLTEVKKKNNEKNVRMLMDKSFSIRRHEVIKEPLIADFKTRWPALFRKEEVCAEFERITTAPLVSRLFANMDAYIAKLMKIFASRGGVVGQRIKTLLMPTTQTDDVEVKRECIIKSLCVYLNEDPSSLILEFMDTDGASTQEAIQKAVMGIYVIRYEGADVEGSPADVGVVLEGEKVLQDLCSVPYATAMLLGLIYGLNLSYPPELRYTFEVLQKLFLELDGNKLSNKVQTLKTKLFSVFE